jgi:lipopolysaccharide/colanic/teichoic acid biosynthesis glycosyltransferase
MGKLLKKRLLFIILDILTVGLSFIIIVWFKPGEDIPYLSRYFFSFIVFLCIWIFISSVFKKFQYKENYDLKNIVLPILASNFIILCSVTFLMYLLRVSFYSRTIVFGTILLATFLEFLLANIFYLFKIAIVYQNPPDNEYLALKTLVENGKINGNNNSYQTTETISQLLLPETVRETIKQECGEGGLSFITDNTKYNSNETLVVSTTSAFNIEAQPEKKYKGIINLKRINDIRFLNKFFKTVNSKIPVGGIFIGCGETKNIRKNRIFKKYPFLLNFFFYYFLDFPIKRVMPKFKITQGLYNFLTRGQNRVITRAEMLGRLAYCGFEAVNEAYVDRLYYFTVKKVREPSVNPNATYGLFVRLKRIGKNGRPIKVTKLRTMHPFAEYLQDYMYNMHDLKEGGKFNHDFRVSTQGRIMRRLFIDELPMLYNWIKRDMKLFGVRPISEQYFKLYNKELQEKRVKFKPGLVPPYYADLPKTLEEIQKSEMSYLEAYEKRPFRTDWKYFWRAVYNIVFKKARSQ